MCGWIIGTAMIGAITRLTDSGLSIMDWAAGEFWWPSAEQITDYYLLYQKTPESQITAFTREEFTPRFFLEWFHRNWGRALGVIALAGLIYYAARRQIPRSVAPVVIAAPWLIGFQGFLGWFMVYSGFETHMGVDHYRLALHLGGAIVALGLFYWTALKILYPAPRWNIPARPWAWAFSGLLITLLFGAFTAGLNAAEASSSWPNFHPGQFLPAGLCDGAQSPWRPACWVNSQRGVHFVHRNIALIAAGLLIFASIRTLMISRSSPAKGVAVAGIGLVITQMTLGIWLVVAGGLFGDPTLGKYTLAVLHQLVALALFLTTLTALYGRARH